MKDRTGCVIGFEKLSFAREDVGGLRVTFETVAA